MTDDRTKLQIETYEKALGRLHDVAAMDETDVVRDALIQRFEFTYEMAWKSAWRWLRGRGENLADKAYEVLPSAFQARLIADAELWEKIRDYRNLTSHTYKEALAIEVAAFVRAKALPAFDALLAELKARA